MEGTSWKPEWGFSQLTLDTSQTAPRLLGLHPNSTSRLPYSQLKLLEKKLSHWFFSSEMNCIQNMSLIVFSYYCKENIDYLLDVQPIFIQQRSLTLGTWVFLAGEKPYQREENLEFTGIICVYAFHPIVKLLALTHKATDHSQNFLHPDLEWGLNSALPHPMRVFPLPICWLIALPLSCRSCSGFYE